MGNFRGCWSTDVKESTLGKNKERTKKINAKYNGLTFTIKLDQRVIRNKNTAKYMLTRGQFKFWAPMV